MVASAATIGTKEAESYSCFDFRLRSDLPLSELTPAAAEDGRPLVEVRLAPVPEGLPGAGARKFGVEAVGGSALLTVPKVGRYLVRDGREIIVDPLPGAPERDVRLFLLGSALGLLCHQRGMLPLHANAVVADGQAFAFAGVSGAGKSTLAAYFQAAGYELLSDDVCMVGFDGGDRPCAWPGLPRLKLWADAAAAFGHDPSRLERVLEGTDKYHVPVAREGAARPVPLRRLYLLSRGDGPDGAEIARLNGQEAMAAVMAHTYRGLYLEPLGLRARHFRQCAALLSSVRVYSAPRAWGFDRFEQEAKRLEEHMIGEQE